VTFSSLPTTINVLTVVLVPTASSVTNYLRCANGNNSNNNANGIYSLNGTLYQASNTFSKFNNNTLYVRNIADPSCMAISASATKINTVLFRLLFKTVSLTQPSCAMPSGSIISIATQSGVQSEWYNVSDFKFVLRFGSKQLCFIC
jgi:hypothetical protein